MTVFFVVGTHYLCFTEKGATCKLPYVRNMGVLCGHEEACIVNEPRRRPEEYVHYRPNATGLTTIIATEINLKVQQDTGLRPAVVNRVADCSSTMTWMTSETSGMICIVTGNIIALAPVQRPEDRLMFDTTTIGRKSAASHLCTMLNERIATDKIVQPL